MITNFGLPATSNPGSYDSLHGSLIRRVVQTRQHTVCYSVEWIPKNPQTLLLTFAYVTGEITDNITSRIQRLLSCATGKKDSSRRASAKTRLGQSRGWQSEKTNGESIGSTVFIF